jgi:hypothetical protein
MFLDYFDKLSNIMFSIEIQYITYFYCFYFYVHCIMPLTNIHLRLWSRDHYNGIGTLALWLNSQFFPFKITFSFSCVATNYIIIMYDLVTSLASTSSWTWLHKTKTKTHYRIQVYTQNKYMMKTTLFCCFPWKLQTKNKNQG